MLERDAILAELPERLHQLLDRHGREYAASPALYEGDITLSYGELRLAVDLLQAQLLMDGVRAGDRVMLVAENCRLLVAALLALSRLDAWAVVVNARLSASELNTIEQHCTPRRVLFASTASGSAARHAQRVGAQPRDVAHLGGFHIGALNSTCLIEPVEQDSAAQVAVMIYTTGTTGEPKGVMLTHRNLLYIACTASRLRHLRRDDRVYAVLPISHVFGLTAVCLASLYSGAALQLQGRFDAEELARALAEDGVTLMQGVPAMFARLLEFADQQGIELRAPRLRFLYAGGSPLDMSLKETVEQRFGVPLHNGYGLTESSPTVSQTRIDAPRRDTSVGRPIPGLEILLLDNARHSAVARGEVGELWVRGPNVMKGYYRAAKQTAQVLTADGWLNTGDLARQDDEGALFIVGRSKELIIRSGFNVYPPEVEAVLNTYPGVVLSAVVGRPVAGNEEVVAFVQVADAARFDVQALTAHLAEHLSPYKRPSHVRVLSTLPCAASGKVLKHQLKAMSLDL